MEHVSTSTIHLSTTFGNLKYSLSKKGVKQLFLLNNESMFEMFICVIEILPWWNLSYFDNKVTF